MALAAAIWAVAMQAMKNARQTGGAKPSQAEQGQAQPALAKHCGNAPVGGALEKPIARGSREDALAQNDGAPASAVAAAGEGNAQGGFDFQEFIRLVMQLCNSSFSSGSAIGGNQDQQEGQEGLPGTQPQAGAQAQTVDPAVNEKRMETIAILGRHEDKFKKAVDGKGLDKMLNDDKTPDDLKRAIQNLKDDPEMMKALDQAKTGKTDGKISAKDINILQGNTANKAFAEQKAQDFEETYVPSDCKDLNAQPRPITNNDAQRELFRYSDYLPKHVSRESLQKIVDGTAEQGKAPPQLVAAAKFYVDNPAAWEKDMGKGADDSIRKDGLCNRFAKSMELTADEDKTLKVLDENRDTFFGGGSLKDSKLKQISEDPAAKPEVRDAATALLDKKGSLLYAMLDNGKHGHGGNLINAADDHNIGRGDLDRVLQDRNKEIAPAEVSAPPPAEKTGTADKTGKAAPTSAASDPNASRASKAAQDMSEGQQDQPDAKKKKGGQLRDIATFFLKVYSVIMNVASSVLSVLAKVPGLGLIAAPAAMAASAASGAASIGVAALKGEDTKKAAMMAGIGVAGTAVGLVIPGGGKLVAESAKVAAKEGAKETGEAAAKQGVKEGVKAGGQKWGQQEIVAGTAIRNDVVAKEAGKAAGKSLGMSGIGFAAEQSGFTDAASNRATNETHAYQQQQERQRLAEQRQQHQQPAA